MLWMSLAAAACDGSVVVPAVDEALTAWRAVNLNAFDKAVGLLDANIPCVGERLTPRLAADVHRVQALAAFGREDPLSTRLAFAAARRIEPATGLSNEIAPPGHPLRAAFEAINPATTRFEDLPNLGDFTIHLDGAPGHRRPTDLPTLFQLVPPEGQPSTTYLWPSDPLPIPDVPRTDLEERPSGKKKPLPFIGLGAAGLGVVAAGLYGGGVMSRSAYDDPDTATAALDGLKSRTNGLVAASGVAAGAALGMITLQVALPKNRTKR
jgi:hypothetical protein